jgi:nucleotide-binding universal stress UspA family protein
MKLIIAHDGSTYADAAIDDLPRAGFPRDSDVLVASVADFSAGKPALSEFDLVSAASRRVDAVLAQARQHDARVLKETGAMASKVVSRIRRQFPEWNVDSEVLRGMPAAELLRKVDEWKADLIMGGSQGRSAIGRFFLGSVSKSVAEEAASSVRVVRRGFEKAADEPIEILLGAKDPAEAERIVEAVGRRVWPADTRVRLVAVDDGVSAGGIAAFYPDEESIYESAAKGLSAVGLRVSVQIERGDPKAILLEAANTWRADAIFVVDGIPDNRSGLDDTASGLITTAKCTVEIVR